MLLLVDLEDIFNTGFAAAEATRRKIRAAASEIEARRLDEMVAEELAHRTARASLHIPWRGMPRYHMANGRFHPEMIPRTPRGPRGSRRRCWCAPDCGRCRPRSPASESTDYEAKGNEAKGSGEARGNEAKGSGEAKGNEAKGSGEAKGKEAKGRAKGSGEAHSIGRGPWPKPAAAPKPAASSNGSSTGGRQMTASEEPSDVDMDDDVDDVMIDGDEYDPIDSPSSDHYGP